MAPSRPRTLAPSAPGCAAKFCSTAMVALELCTTSVITVPTRTPRTGTPATWAIISVKTGLSARGFMTDPMVSMPTKSRPKPNIARPDSFIRSPLASVMTRKPTATNSKM